MHRMGYCDCGREIHWPRNARFGYHWQCYNCGRWWQLAPARHGAKPNYTVPSRGERQPRVVVVHVQPPAQTPLNVNPFIPLPDGTLPPAPPMRQLPPPRRGGLLAWLFGE